MTDYPPIVWGQTTLKPTRRVRLRRWFSSRGPVALGLLGVGLALALTAGGLGVHPTLALGEANAKAERVAAQIERLGQRQNDLTAVVLRSDDPVEKQTSLDLARRVGAQATALSDDLNASIAATDPQFRAAATALGGILTGVALIIAGLVTGHIRARRKRA